MQEKIICTPYLQKYYFQQKTNHSILLYRKKSVTNIETLFFFTSQYRNTRVLKIHQILKTFCISKINEDLFVSLNYA